MTMETVSVVKETFLLYFVVGVCNATTNYSSAWQLTIHSSMFFGHFCCASARTSYLQHICIGSDAGTAGAAGATTHLPL